MGSSYGLISAGWSSAPLSWSRPRPCAPDHRGFRLCAGAGAARGTAKAQRANTGSRPRRWGASRPMAGACRTCTGTCWSGASTTGTGAMRGRRVLEQQPQELPLGLPPPRRPRQRLRQQRVPRGLPPPGPFFLALRPLVPQPSGPCFPWLLGCGIFAQATAGATIDVLAQPLQPMAV